MTTDIDKATRIRGGGVVSKRIQFCGACDYPIPKDASPEKGYRLVTTQERGQEVICPLCTNTTNP